MLYKLQYSVVVKKSNLLENGADINAQEERSVMLCKLRQAQVMKKWFEFRWRMVHTLIHREKTMAMLCKPMAVKLFEFCGKVVQISMHREEACGIRPEEVVRILAERM